MKTFQLTRPVTHDGKTYDALTVREPKAGDMEQAERIGDEYGFTLALIARAAGVSIEVVDKMGQIDTEFVGAYIEDFIAVQTDEVPDATEWLMKLAAPVTLGDLVYAELALREPINSERRVAAKAGKLFAVIIKQISLIASVPTSAVREMTASDFLLAARYFEGFSARRPRTGKSGAPI